MDYGLGRRPQFDHRSLGFPLRAALPDAVVRRTRYWAYFGQVLDQGSTGTCVAHAWHARLQAAPVVRKAATLPRPFDLYRKIVLNDDWPENDAEATAPDVQLQSGTSTLAAAKTCQQLGYISEYRWALSIDDVIDALCAHGPLCTGVAWYDSFFDPDREGSLTIAPGASVVGGHEFVLIGWDNARGRIRMLNSWSRTWGQSGRAWLAAETFERLLREDGDACTPTEVLAPR